MTPGSRRPSDTPSVRSHQISGLTPRAPVAIALAALAAIGATTLGSAASAQTTYTQYPLVASGPGPVAITAGSDGNVWFSVPGGSGAIGRMTDAGTVTLFTSGLSSQPTDGADAITGGPDGNVWFTEQPGVSSTTWEPSAGSRHREPSTRPAPASHGV